MLKPKALLFGACLAALIATLPIRAESQEPQDPNASKTETETGDAAGRYCSNIATTAVESRIAWQIKRLNELDALIKQRIAELDAKEAEARDWVSKREEMLKQAGDDVVAIYAKMRPEAASAQLNAMDDASAVAILSKLNPRAASAILNEMEAARAAKLADLISADAKSANAASPTSPAPGAVPTPAPPPADGKKS
jgi:flagellar motility protein MotE (MotC chaperone)